MSEAYHPTKIKPLVKIISRLLTEHPQWSEDPDRMMSELGCLIPDFHNKKKCINCNASMAEYIYEFSVLDAILLYGMAKEVKERMDKGLPFTEANQIHIPSSSLITYTAKNRTGYSGKLGLIAKVIGDNKRHVPGLWAITRRGFEALRGIPVPKSVRVFRAQILERTEEMITIGQVFSEYSHKTRGKILRGKGVKVDYRSVTDTYSPNDWVNIAGMHQGSLL